MINQLGEIRTKGETTKFYNLKSLAIYADKRFGEKRFSYELFPEEALEASGSATFRQVSISLSREAPQ